MFYNTSMDADKEEIRARNDIVEVVGAVVQLQRRGRNYVGLCPFHREKTPSFNVDPVTQTFKCFGCGAFGDVFTFVERHQNMSFVEAAEYLARRVGLTYARKGQSAQQRTEREPLYELNAVALTYFRNCLHETPAAQQYLQRRMLLPETVERFQIGFAPDTWDGLAQYLRRRKMDLALAASCGLLAARRSGDGYVDVFRNRIMFPIHDEQMRVVGFGGRALGDEQPKYRNSPESPIFVKNRLLYALPFARRRIAEEGRTLVLEGYVDVITAHQAGFENAVATLGTAFTTEHARRLARLAPAAVVVYDADAAGIKAALRAASELEEQGLATRIARLPEGQDPDSLIRSGRPELFARAVTDAVTRVEMEIDLARAAADLSSEYGRQQLLRHIISILATVPTRTERDLYVEHVWQLHPMSAQGPSIAKEQLHRDAEEARRRLLRARVSQAGVHRDQAGSEPPQQPTAISSAVTARAVGRMAVPEMVIVRALAMPELRRIVLQSAEPADLIHEADQQLLEFLLHNPPDPEADEAALVRWLRLEADEELASRAVERLQESSMVLAKEPLNEKVVSDSLGRLRQRRTELLMARLRERLKTKFQLTEEDRALLDELQRLQKRTADTSN